MPAGKLPFEKLTLPLPATAVTVPPHALVTPGAAATGKFAGKVSVKLASTAITLGLFTLKVSVLEAFTDTVPGTKALVILSGSKITIGAVMVCRSTVASALPFPLVVPALNVAVAWALASSASGWAWGMLPRIELLNVT